jgi:hypothetical protein
VQPSKHAPPNLPLIEFLIIGSRSKPSIFLLGQRWLL